MIEAWEEEQMSNLGCESVSDLIEEVKRLRERNDRLCEDLKRTRRWIQKQVRPLKILAGQADLVAYTAKKELLNEFMGDD
jgi:hypothetical protein|tara:strand:+ start:139 stop:378 length:240 start_codon:yes stop_codon:yes gene_type:complete